MNWLISPAQAAEAGAQAQPDWWGWVWLAFLIVFFYFFLISPQRKREKAQAALMAALKQGDEVVTQAGLVGVIAKVEDDFVQVKVGPTTLRFQKAAVIGTLPKGTLEQFDDEDYCAATTPIEAEPAPEPSDNVVKDEPPPFRLFGLEGFAVAIIAVPPAG